MSVCQGEEGYVDHYVKVENGDSDLKVISPTLSFSGLRARHHSTRSDAVATTSADLSCVKLRDLKAMPKSYKAFYNQTTRELVEKVYGEDIKRYGYHFDSPNW